MRGRGEPDCGGVGVLAMKRFVVFLVAHSIAIVLAGAAGWFIGDHLYIGLAFLVACCTSEVIALGSAFKWCLE